MKDIPIDNAEKITEAIASTLDTFNSKEEMIADILIRMEKAQTLQEFFHLKANLLTYLIGNLPVYEEHCPLCDMYECWQCPLAEESGACREENSLYRKVVVAFEKLAFAIRDLYGCVEDHTEET